MDKSTNISSTTKTSTEDGKKVDKSKCLIIAAGFGRTGTMSLKIALEKLGYGPCYHMKEIIEDSSQSDFWQRVYYGGKYSWGELFEKYNSSTDNPVCEFWEEILKEYPNSKIILNTRNPEAWLKSIKETIFLVRVNVPFGVSFMFNTFLRKRKSVMSKVTSMIFGYGENYNTSDEHIIKTFNDWNKKVEERCPKDKFLKWEIKEGWKPICQFLGIETPNEDFPRVNDTQEFKDRINKLNIVGYVIFFLLISLLMALVYYFKTRFFSHVDLTFGLFKKQDL